MSGTTNQTNVHHTNQPNHYCEELINQEYKPKLIHRHKAQEKIGKIDKITFKREYHLDGMKNSASVKI